MYTGSQEFLHRDSTVVICVANIEQLLIKSSLT